MRNFVIMIAALLGLVAAMPVAKLERTLGTFSTSTGFTLIANVTDPKRDLNPSVNYFALDLYHTGAGSTIAALNGTDGGRVWYLNGTMEQLNHGHGHILTDQGQPAVPYGMMVQNTTQYDAEAEHGVFANAGPGTTHFFFSILNTCRVPLLVDNYGSDGSFMACRRPVPYYSNQEFITIEYAFLTCMTADNKTVMGHAASGDRNCTDNIPADCAPINFLPQCKPLNNLPQGSLSNHKFAYTQPCFKNVSSVDWSEVCTFETGTGDDCESE